jgi:hypothetical protein
MRKGVAGVMSPFVWHANESLKQAKSAKVPKKQKKEQKKIEKEESVEESGSEEVKQEEVELKAPVKQD